MIEIRASAVPAWGDCAARAMHIAEYGKPARDEEAVALAVGNAVHKRITGHEFEPAQRLRFDAETRTAKEMNRQVDSMANRGTLALAEHGLTVKAKEKSFDTARIKIGKIQMRVRGTADMLCETDNNEIVLVDLKTGAHPPKAAWLQLATYAWLADANDVEIDACGILWLPRKRTGGDGKFWQRPAPELLPMAKTMLRKIAAAYATTAAPNPSSLHCSTCPKSDCVARLTP